jgi:hypothetical protein
MTENETRSKILLVCLEETMGRQIMAYEQGSGVRVAAVELRRMNVIDGAGQPTGAGHVAVRLRMEGAA